MNVWKYGPVLLLVIAVVSGCSSSATTPTASTAPAATAADKPPETTAAPAPAAPPKVEEPAPAPVPKPVTVPAETALNVILVDALSTKTNKPGDTFHATMAAPLVVGGKTVLEKGAEVQGRVVDAERAGKVKGLASMRLVLTGVTHGGKVIPIVTNSYFVEAESTKKRDAEIIGGAAGVGAAIGAIAGGGKGALIGAGVGGGAGTGTVLATRGKEVEFKPESKLKFTLEKPLEVR
jgi:hypothetical protein